ncbi:hypothetical protein PT974_09485 [Cladobotryum mycophilum]|uniref:Uncharacterized protein n=1 Tax=Cladobotryum mycophilum TaxID=491253 RepID=A0ABR0SG99_9HYPO
MPTRNGNVWAVALTDNDGTILTAGVSVAMTLIFIRCWSIVCFVAMVFPGTQTRRRFAALVTLRNSNDPLFAFRELAVYSARYFRHSWADFMYGVTFCVLALLVFGASTALGIVGTSMLQVGSVASPLASTLYYPENVSREDRVGTLQRYGLLAAANLRALGSAESARGRVDFNFERLGNWDNEETMGRLSYNFSITGVDLGLQHGTDLALTVSGSCITEYGWIVHQNETQDVYNLWGLPNGKNTVVPIDRYSIANAPTASFVRHPNGDAQYLKDGNSSYAVVVASAHRASIKPGGDFWYKTEPRVSNYSAVRGVQLWVKRGRPVLSCWQQDRWRYASHSANVVYDLRTIPGIKIKDQLLDLMEIMFSTPVLVDLGIVSGDSALKSRMTSPYGVINAEGSSMVADMERLILATFVRSRNVFADTTKFYKDYQDNDTSALINMMSPRGTNIASDFVVPDPAIQTFSMVGLIVLAVVLVAELLMELTLRMYQAQSDRLLRESPPVVGPLSREMSEQSAKPSASSRFKALSATQLFRRIYETEEAQPHEHWKCTQIFPMTNDEMKFKLQRCSHHQCKGHIERRSSLTPPSSARTRDETV